MSTRTHALVSRIGLFGLSLLAAGLGAGCGGGGSDGPSGPVVAVYVQNSPDEDLNGAPEGEVFTGGSGGATDVVAVYYTRLDVASSPVFVPIPGGALTPTGPTSQMFLGFLPPGIYDIGVHYASVAFEIDQKLYSGAPTPTLFTIFDLSLADYSDGGQPVDLTAQANNSVTLVVQMP
jgi:hypothetical protein